jgi:DNA-binding transcriptional regulator YiaG
MAKTLQELLASRSPESQARIQKMADELLLETQLHLIREELEISQKELAATLGIKQPHCQQSKIVVMILKFQR